MVRSADMSNTIPDEKVVITYVTYLCARLLDIRQETRAARVIQAAWRNYRNGKTKQVIMVRFICIDGNIFSYNTLRLRACLCSELITSTNTLSLHNLPLTILAITSYFDNI